jgi:hypothetical protein
MKTELINTFILLLKEIADNVDSYQRAVARDAGPLELKYLRKRLNVLWEEAEKVKILFTSEPDEY